MAKIYKLLDEMSKVMKSNLSEDIKLLVVEDILKDITEGE